MNNPILGFTKIQILFFILLCVILIAETISNILHRLQTVREGYDLIPKVPKIEKPKLSIDTPKIRMPDPIPDIPGVKIDLSGPIQPIVDGLNKAIDTAINDSIISKINTAVDKVIKFGNHMKYAFVGIGDGVAGGWNTFQMLADCSVSKLVTLLPCSFFYFVDFILYITFYIIDTFVYSLRYSVARLVYVSIIVSIFFINTIFRIFSRLTTDSLSGNISISELFKEISPLDIVIILVISIGSTIGLNSYKFPDKVDVRSMIQPTLDRFDEYVVSPLTGGMFHINHWNPMINTICYKCSSKATIDAGYYQQCLAEASANNPGFLQLGRNWINCSINKNKDGSTVVPISRIRDAKWVDEVAGGFKKATKDTQDGWGLFNSAWSDLA